MYCQKCPKPGGWGENWFPKKTPKVKSPPKKIVTGPPTSCRRPCVLILIPHPSQRSGLNPLHISPHSFTPGLGQHYHIEEDIVRIPRKKSNSNPSMRRNSSASGAEDALSKLRTSTTTSTGHSSHPDDEERASRVNGEVVDDGIDDDDDDEDDEDSYVNITVKRDDPIADAMKVVEVSGSVDERRAESMEGHTF